MRELLRDHTDLMVVVGGYNSSNTCALAALAQDEGVRALHLADAESIDPEAATIRYQPVRSKREEELKDWLGEARVIGITAGASTPNNKIGETVVRIAASAGLSEELDRALAANFEAGS